uniref:F-box domain-containing protein n=1 Tax=Moniliophthora roreri TaxID=221103 RepID=A0A0W0EX11_MONRR
MSRLAGRTELEGLGLGKKRVPAERSLAFAPGDLLLEIAGYLDTRMDLFNFCSTNNRIFTNVSSILYAEVVLSSAEQCKATLAMLSRRRDIARHVRELIIRPRSKKPSSHQFFDAVVASAAVRECAIAFTLDALAKFTWDSDELPYFDDMWFALRVCCPRLKHISTSIGSILPALNSHLFDFNDLRGFAFLLKPGFFENHPEMFFEGAYSTLSTKVTRLNFIEEERPVSRRFWEMLIERCPNLEELAIDGISTFPTEAHHILEGRWPKLRKLILGDVVVDRPGMATGTSRSPFIDFLEAHPLLEDLSLSRANVGHTELSSLNPDTFKLRSFSGTLEQLQAMPHAHHYLESVTFRESMQTREVTSLVVAGLLQRLTSLTKLKISFTLHSMYDSGNLLKSLIASCPNLRHLELVCGHRPSFQIVRQLFDDHQSDTFLTPFPTKDTFSKTIRGFTKLRVLHLSIVRYPGDENLAAGAARIAMANPRLENFTLTFLPMKYPISLPFSMSLFLFTLRTKASGSFTLTCDNHGLPLTLRAFERRRLVWPMGLGCSYRTKRYTSDLRPAGSPSRSKKGLKGFMSLLSENSAAGEELRMIAFCAFLVCLAVWGFLVNREFGHT